MFYAMYKAEPRELTARPDYQWTLPARDSSISFSPLKTGSISLFLIPAFLESIHKAAGGFGVLSFTAECPGKQQSYGSLSSVCTDDHIPWVRTGFKQMDKLLVMFYDL